MRKIGILTFHWVYNFGANLQTYSTYNNLLAIGYDPIIINWIPEDDEFFQKNLVGSGQVKEHQAFSSLMKKTKLCRNARDIAEEIKSKEIDAVIIGSDAVFNIRKQRYSFRTGKKLTPLSDHRFPNPFWGEFNMYLEQRVPISALSVSCQNAPFTCFFKEKKQIFSSLTQFSHITVRDKRTAEMVEYFMDGTCTPDITPDPVWAFIETPAFYRSKSEIIEKYNIPENYVLLSFEDNNLFSEKWLNGLQRAIDRYAPVVNLEKIIGNRRLNATYHIDSPIPVEDWYYLIKYSKGYVGVLMHPLIVALKNNVPVYSFDTYGEKNLLRFPKKETSKIYDLMERNGLLSNYHMCTIYSKLPSVETVAEALLNYNFNNRVGYSDFFREKYLRTLRKVITDL